MSDDQFKDFWPYWIDEATNEDKTYKRDYASQVRLSGKVLKYRNFIKNYKPKNINQK